MFDLMPFPHDELLFLSTQRAQAVLQAVSAVQDGSSPSSDPGVLDLAPPPSPVLRIIIDNMFYPVTLDVLQQVGKLNTLFRSTIQITTHGLIVKF